MEEGRWITTKYGNRVFIGKSKAKSTNEYMNEKIKQSVQVAKGGQPIYKKYDDDEYSFMQDNPNVVLQEQNQIIREWTEDEGGYHSNSGIMRYLNENKKYGEHPGWEQGVKDIDSQITGRLSTNITTYRTVQIPVKQLNVGDSVDIDGFIATSISRAESNKRFNYGDARSSTIEVEVDSGTRCLYIGSKTGREEKELLFPTEYKIQITSKEREYDEDGDYIRTIFKGKMINK